MVELLPWLKGFHVIGIVLWLGAMAVQISLLNQAAEADQPERRKAIGERARAVYLRFQSTGLGLVLITGIVQMVTYMQAVEGWMKASRWIHWKLMMVIGLLVIDHILMRRALKVRKSPENAPGAVRIHVMVAVALVIVTIFLATVQPTR